LHYPDGSGTIPSVNQNPDRTNPDELLPLTEAAQRLGIAYDTARKRIKAGTLEGERRGGRLYAWVPRPENGSETISGERPEGSGSVPDETEPNPDVLVAQLRGEVAFLRQQVDRQAHIIMNLTHAVQAIPARVADQDAPVTHERAPTASERSDQFWNTPAEAPSALRGWIRRLLGRSPE
jgi:hypothetical protein